MSECCTNPGIRPTHTPKGRIHPVAGNNTYEVGSGDHVLIFSPDLFGNSFISPQRNADAFADAGFHVYIPDCFQGQPMDADVPDLMAALPDFLQRHPPDHASKYLKIVADHVLQQSPPPKSLSFIGFCYGCKPITVLLLNNTHIHSKTNAVVFNHPSFLVKEEADQWSKIPLHINEAETDGIFVPELRAHWEKALTAKKLGSFKEFPGTEHGFVARPKNETEEKARAEAISLAIQFLKKHAGF